MVFLVNPNDVIKAVGRRGERAEMLKALVKREIQVIAFSQDPTKFPTPSSGGRLTYYHSVPYRWEVALQKPALSAKDHVQVKS